MLSPPDSTDLTLSSPTADDGTDVWNLIADCHPLDRNSVYCNLLQCTDFADTCILAKCDDHAVGWVSGYRPPGEPSALFIWQVAVRPDMRGSGLAKTMLLALLDRPACAGVDRIKTTITPDNEASWSLFDSVASALEAPITRRPWFDERAHFDGRHDSEYLVTIGPFAVKQDSVRSSVTPLNSHQTRNLMSTNTEIPNEPLFSTFEKLESEVRSYARNFPTLFERAEGSYLYDKNGRQYLDFLMGCSTLNYGHNPKALKQALIDYIASDGITHSLDMYSEAKERFLAEFHRTILKPRELDYVLQFPGPTGANAVEAALKLARKVTGRHNVIAFTNGFHGVTLGALACTGNDHHRGGAGLPLTGVTRMPYDQYMGEGVDTADYLDRVLSDPSSGIDEPAAIIVETVQGEGGLNTASYEWLRKIELIARKHGALFIVDDIQAGIGRAGGFFSFETARLRPDIVTMAKSISGYGLPMALVLIDRQFDEWAPGEHNGTFRGNCHAFVTARSALEAFWRSDDFEASVRKLGGLLEERLAEIADRYGPRLVAAKGRGMMRGLDMRSGEIAGLVVKAAFDKGLVIETSGPNDEVVKCLAPLTIQETDLNRGLDILEQSIDSVMFDVVKKAA